MYNRRNEATLGGDARFCVSTCPPHEGTGMRMKKGRQINDVPTILN